MSGPEFSRPFDRRSITAEPVTLLARQEECAALAARFDLPAICSLSASLELRAEGQVVHARGRMAADIVQTCAVSGEELPVRIEEDITLRFVPPRTFRPDEEIELEEGELDEIEYEGTGFDLGEAVAQSLVLAVDPFFTGPEAERVRAQVLDAQEASGPFASLVKLTRD